MKIVIDLNKLRRMVSLACHIIICDSDLANLLYKKIMLILEDYLEEER